jgi:hypothetical protein
MMVLKRRISTMPNAAEYGQPEPGGEKMSKKRQLLLQVELFKSI